MLHFGLKEKNLYWHVGEGIPRLNKVEYIYATGAELGHLQSLGFGLTALSSVTLCGDLAIQALTAMRLAVIEQAKVSEEKPQNLKDGEVYVWKHNTHIDFWGLSIPEQMVYTTAYTAEFQYGNNPHNTPALVARNALYSFWRVHGCPRFTFPPGDMSFRFADDDWGR